MSEGGGEVEKRWWRSSVISRYSGYACLQCMSCRAFWFAPYLVGYGEWNYEADCSFGFE